MLHLKLQEQLLLQHNNQLPIMVIMHFRWFVPLVTIAVSNLNPTDFHFLTTLLQLFIKQSQQKKQRKQQLLIGMFIMAKEHRKYFTIAKMFSLFLCIAMIMESFSHIFLNHQAKIQESEREWDIMLMCVGIWQRNQKESNIREKKLVEINNMRMHFQNQSCLFSRNMTQILYLLAVDLILLVEILLEIQPLHLQVTL